VSQSIDDLVRETAAEILRERAPGRFLCIPCLMRQVQNAHGTAYTRGQIERSLAVVARSPGSLTFLPSVVCDRCGKTAPCLGAKPASHRWDSGV